MRESFCRAVQLRPGLPIRVFAGRTVCRRTAAVLNCSLVGFLFPVIASADPAVVPVAFSPADLFVPGSSVAGFAGPAFVLFDRGYPGKSKCDQAYPAKGKKRYQVEADRSCFYRRQ